MRISGRKKIAMVHFFGLRQVLTCFAVILAYEVGFYALRDLLSFREVDFCLSEVERQFRHSKRY